MKEGNDTTAGDFIEEFKQTSAFRGATLEEPSTADRQQLAIFKMRFHQGLVDNLLRRFSSSGSLKGRAKVLQKANWPAAEDALLLYGDGEVVKLMKLVKVPTEHMLEIINQF